MVYYSSTAFYLTGSGHVFTPVNRIVGRADDAPSSRNGIVPWSSAAVPLTALSSYVLLCVSSSSKCGLDACSVHGSSQEKEAVQTFDAWTFHADLVSQRRMGIVRARLGRRLG